MANRENGFARKVAYLVLPATVLGVVLPITLTGANSMAALLIGLLGIVGCAYVVHPGYDRYVNAVGAGGVLAFFVGGFMFWSPMWQGVFYAGIIKNPGGLQWLILGVLFAVAIAALKPMVRINDSGYSTDEELTGWAYVSLGFLALGVLGFILIGPLIGGAYTSVHMADHVDSNADSIEELPDSDQNRSRIAPEGVAKNWGENSLQYPQYRMEGGDITYVNGTPHWSYSLSPNGMVNTFTLDQRGAVYVNQSSFSKDITVHDEQRFDCGEGVLLTDSYDWTVKNNDYTNDYKDAFVVPHEGDSYLVVPYTEHSWEFRATPVPQMYSVPEFGGVKVIDQDCNIEDLSPEEAQNSEVLGETQNYYPYDLAKFKVESMAYQHGVLNTLVGHQDQLEVAGVPGDGNSQPFTVPTEDDGIQYIVAAEPWGDANGIYQVWTIDAQTGDMSVNEFDQQDALRGPRKAVDSVMGHPEISRLNDVSAVEPIPVVVDGDLYWQVRVIPDSSARITYVAFFDAQTEDVAVVESTEEVGAFLADQDVPETDTGNESDRQQGPTCDFVVVVEYPDGESERVCVPDGGSVSLEDGNATVSD